MAADPLAPWAEPVVFTAADLMSLPDDAWRYELVRGRLVRMPPAGWEHGTSGSRLAIELGRFVRDRGLGETTLAETGFLISEPDEPDTVLAPDIAFVSTARLPAPDSPDWTRFPRLAPDLVVEVASPDQRCPELAAEARIWLQAGVKLVWVVWPRLRQVDVWRPGADAPQLLEGTAELRGEDIVPGFRSSIARLWT